MGLVLVGQLKKFDLIQKSVKITSANTNMLVKLRIKSTFLWDKLIIAMFIISNVSVVLFFDYLVILQMVEHSYSKPSKSSKTALTTIYRSEEIDPGVITECERLGCIDIPYPEDFDDVKDCFHVRFYFGETMIRVTVTMKGREYVEHEVQIKYDFGVQHLDAAD
ncbi:hypothetical protein RFI_26840 [Reticulomyxa filosa]|uniref:Uncharacterized protein n=1 Tax=Reticulomyxa filosa TaxID=46433 RepID=X6MAP1_RETFI|nr:hypothetical protein RFI_26840 [Reticulomyxa filosa]|eukprot:ETO10537.1 hypothetical protein RFI_26840 [Reticulomyxa filosa]